jgi:hypothetical protein
MLVLILPGWQDTSQPNDFGFVTGVCTVRDVVDKERGVARYHAILAKISPTPCDSAQFWWQDVSDAAKID